MNSFMSWVGGKKALRDEVIIRMPPFYEKYIEVFGGAGWVLFRKSPENEVEVFNDFNSNLVNLYRCVRDNPAKLKYKLRYVLNSREDFRWIAFLHKKACFRDFMTMTALRNFTSSYATATAVRWTALQVSPIQFGGIFR